jgi:hypothetical protein
MVALDLRKRSFIYSGRVTDASYRINYYGKIVDIKLVKRNKITLVLRNLSFNYFMKFML